MAAGENLDKPVLGVEHFNLEPAGRPNQLKSVCPVCKEGLLLVIRDIATMELQEFDHCSLCGQRVRYTDIARMRHHDRLTG